MESCIRAQRTTKTPNTTPHSNRHNLSASILIRQVTNIRSLIWSSLRIFDLSTAQLEPRSSYLRSSSTPHLYSVESFFVAEHLSPPLAHFGRVLCRALAVPSPNSRQQPQALYQARTTPEIHSISSKHPLSPPTPFSTPIHQPHAQSYHTTPFINLTILSNLLQGQQSLFACLILHR